MVLGSLKLDKGKNMWLLLAEQNRLFALALVLMLLLGVLEMISLFSGSFTSVVDSILPESLDQDVSLDGAGVWVRFLDWLYIGRVPLMMVLVIALAVFGCLGMAMQQVVFSVSGRLMSSWLATPLSAILSLPLIRSVTAMWYRIMPKDETSAIAEGSLIGRIGIITLGNADAQNAAQVRVKDSLGHQHYIMAIVDDGQKLEQGCSVLVVAQQGHLFRVIRNVHTQLLD